MEHAKHFCSSPLICSPNITIIICGESLNEEIFKIHKCRNLSPWPINQIPNALFCILIGIIIFWTIYGIFILFWFQKQRILRLTTLRIIFSSAVMGRQCFWDSKETCKIMTDRWGYHAGGCDVLFWEREIDVQKQYIFCLRLEEWRWRSNGR